MCRDPCGHRHTHTNTLTLDIHTSVQHLYFLHTVSAHNQSGPQGDTSVTWEDDKHVHSCVSEARFKKAATKSETNFWDFPLTGAFWAGKFFIF